MNTLETKRLLLRDWKESDLGCGVHNDDVIHYLMEVKNNYAMVIKKTGKIIGTIGLNEDADGNPNLRNVGVRVIEGYRNQGYMQEALTEVFLHAELPIAGYSWFCAADNAPSLHLAEKFGFIYVKTFSKDEFNLPAPCDHQYFVRK
ncbi:MAG: GNAT family N-acetyltransferase [Clostridia bacterium]|nr:GNAT family N-acetyltransferase [Clostridia bacterium]